jgi:hypothetical protein
MLSPISGGDSNNAFEHYREMGLCSESKVQCDVDDRHRRVPKQSLRVSYLAPQDVLVRSIASRCPELGCKMHPRETYRVTQLYQVDRSK